MSYSTSRYESHTQKSYHYGNTETRNESAFSIKKHTDTCEETPPAPYIALPCKNFFFVSFFATISTSYQEVQIIYERKIASRSLL